MRILYASPRQCWPPVSGAKLRDYYLARALGEGCELTYVYMTDARGPAMSGGDLPFARETVGVPRDGTYTPGKIVRGLVGRWPLPVLNYSTDAMKSALARMLDGKRYDIVHLDSVHLAGCAAELNGLSRRSPVVWNWHNIESEGMERFAAQTDSQLKRWYARWTARQLKSVERYILESGSGHLVCSERERRELGAIAPDARIAVVENGVDAEGFSRIPEGLRNRVLFVGSMNYHANIEASVNFARNIWPAVYDRFRHLRLTLAGADPAPAVTALAALPGVEVTGTVPDVRPYYGEAAVAIVPLRVGAGTRLKILEAMAAGVPVVSTKLGAEGLAVTPGTDILIVEDDREWLAAVERLAGDRELCASLTTAARRLVCTRYDWSVIGDRLLATYREWFFVR